MPALSLTCSEMLVTANDTILQVGVNYVCKRGSPGTTSGRKRLLPTLGFELPLLPQSGYSAAANFGMANSSNRPIAVVGLLLQQQAVTPQNKVGLGFLV